MNEFKPQFGRESDVRREARDGEAERFNKQLVNSLSLLGRIGDRHGKTVEKWMSAGRAVEVYLVELLPHGVLLPRDYIILDDERGGDFRLYIVLGERHISVTESREEVLNFAGELADGWLKEVVRWLEDVERDSVQFNAEALLRFEGVAQRDGNANYCTT